MSKLSPSQKAKLEALWRSLPDTARQAMMMAARSGQAGSDGDAGLLAVFEELEASTREPAGDAAKGYLLMPLKPLVGDPEHTPPSGARFSPEQVSKIWGWLGRHLAKDTIETARKCKKGPSDPIWHEFRGQLGDALHEAIKKAERVPKDMTALAKRFGGGDSPEMLRDAVTLLRNSRVLEDGLERLPPKIFDLDDELCTRLHDVYGEIIEEAPEAAVWFLLISMGRLENSWEIFRVIERIGKRGDDLVVSKTELAAVGDAVLSDTGYFASRLRNPPATREEAKQVFALFERFVAFSTGMTKEFGIRKAGRWGQSLFSLRAEASTNVEKILEKLPLALDSGLPEPRRGKSGRIIPAQLPPESHVDRAEGLAFFTAATRELANAAAVASTQKRIADAAIKRMQDAGEMLVDLVAKSEGQNRTTAQAGLDITAKLLEAMDVDEAASTLRRRGAAAA